MIDLTKSTDIPSLDLKKGDRVIINGMTYTISEQRISDGYRFKRVEAWQ